MPLHSMYSLTSKGSRSYCVVLHEVSVTTIDAYQVLVAPEGMAVLSSENAKMNLDRYPSGVAEDVSGEMYPEGTLPHSA